MRTYKEMMNKKEELRESLVNNLYEKAVKLIENYVDSRECFLDFCKNNCITLPEDMEIRGLYQKVLKDLNAEELFKSRFMDDVDDAVDKRIDEWLNENGYKYDKEENCLRMANSDSNSDSLEE